MLSLIDTFCCYHESIKQARRINQAGVTNQSSRRHKSINQARRINLAGTTQQNQHRVTHQVRHDAVLNQKSLTAIRSLCLIQIER